MAVKVQSWQWYSSYHRVLETLTLKNTVIVPKSQKTSDSFFILIPSGLKLSDGGGFLH